MKIRKIKTILRTLSICLIVSMSSGIVAFADTLSTYDQNRMLGATAVDWQSSSIREWLNSDKTVVDYTAIKPSYKDEAGFLSDNNFTQSERDAIAITKHSGGNSLGNMSKTPYVSQRDFAYNNFLYNDKVFILNYTDLINFVERNKQWLDNNKKYYSDYLQHLTNAKDKYEYTVNDGYYNSGYYGTSVQYSSMYNRVNGRDIQNIVPALSLKPEYILTNGTKAKDLIVGSTITFGKYNGDPIQWQVINKSDNGYPLLWSTKIITQKEYDAPGDINPNTSAYINYNVPEVDLVSLPQSKSWETQGLIKSFPVINIVNESALTTPTNDTQMTLQINVTDSNYPIRRVILPDGTIVNGSYAEWTLTQNGEYDIIAENSIGVMTVRHIVTNAINTPAQVAITTDKDSSTKWTNKPVNVNVSSTNTGAYTITVPAHTSGYTQMQGPSYAFWLPLRGKRLHVTGKFINTLSDADALTIDMTAHITIRMITRSSSNSAVFQDEIEVKRITLQQLKDAVEIAVDETITLPNNIYDSCYPLIRLNFNNSAYMKPPYSYGATAFTFNILDQDDLKITQINLPDGNIVYDDHATYTVFKNGSYTFSAIDNRGKTTSKTIDLAIDTVNPSINITGIQSGYVKDEMIHLNATDDLSGIKSIKLPNGEVRTTTSEGQPLNVDYNITTNGTYQFIATDYAGNTFTKNVSVSNIDTVAPTGVYTLSPSTWTSGSVDIKVQATDNSGGSGVKSITQVNGTTINASSGSFNVTSNGTYIFNIADNLGNTSSLTATVNNIDVIPPTLNVSKTTSWSNSGVIITATSSDTQSGIKSITLPDGNVILGSTATFTVDNVGVYYFSTVDNVGNTAINYIVIDNIDKNKPTTTVTNNQNWTNASGVSVAITGIDQ